MTEIVGLNKTGEEQASGKHFAVMNMDFNSKLAGQTEARESTETIEEQKEVNNEEEKAKYTDSKAKNGDHKKEKKISTEDIDVQPLEEGNTQITLQDYQRLIRQIEIKDFQYVKSLPNPPIKVVKVMQIICILLGEEKVDWGRIKAFLNHPLSLVARMRGLNVRMVPDRIRKKAKLMLSEDGMDRESLSKITPSLSYLAQWTDTVVKYKELLKSREPEYEEIDLKALKKTKAPIIVMRGPERQTN